MTTGTRDLMEALALLPLPSMEQLTEQQVRGFTCVWDEAPLTAAIAVALGERSAWRAGDRVPWYPRACRGCVFAAAMAKLFAHAPGCPTCCNEETAPCRYARSLYWLVREFRR